MVWNVNIPDGNEAISFGDNRIRELKQDLETIFQEDHYFLTDNNNPRLVHSIKMNINRNNRIFYDNELKYRDNNGNVVSWRDEIPLGTKVLFISMPESGRPYWNIVPIIDYVVNLVNSDGGQAVGLVDYFSQSHTHSVNNASPEGHQHTVSFGSTSTNYGSDIKEKVTKFDGTDFQQYTHTHSGFLISSTKSENITHNHILDSTPYNPRYIKGIILERIK